MSIRWPGILDQFYTGGSRTHTLSTGNIPLLRKLVNLPFGGQTPFTAEIWYINKTARRGLKWGTQTPIPVVDPVYNYPVSIRAYGQWGIRIQDSRSFVAQIVGSLQAADSSKVEDYFMGEIVQKVSDTLASFFVQQNLSVFQANARLNDLSRFAQGAIAQEFARFGIEIVHFNVERVSIPEDETKKFRNSLAV